MQSPRWRFVYVHSTWRQMCLSFPICGWCIGTRASLQRIFSENIFGRMSRSIVGMKEKVRLESLKRALSNGISMSGLDIYRTHKSPLPVYAAPSSRLLVSIPWPSAGRLQLVFRVHDQIGNKSTFPRARGMDMLRRRQGSEAKNRALPLCMHVFFPRLLIGFVCSIKHNSHKMDYDVIGTVDWETKLIELFPRWFPDTKQPDPMSSCTCRVGRTVLIKFTWVAAYGAGHKQRIMLPGSLKNSQPSGYLQPFPAKLVGFGITLDVQFRNFNTLIAFFSANKLQTHRDRIFPFVFVFSATFYNKKHWFQYARMPSAATRALSPPAIKKSFVFLRKSLRPRLLAIYEWN